MSTAIVLMGQPVATERELPMTLQLPITNVQHQIASVFKKFVNRHKGVIDEELLSEAQKLNSPVRNPWVAQSVSQLKRPSRKPFCLRLITGVVPLTGGSPSAAFSLSRRASLPASTMIPGRSLFRQDISVAKN